MSTVSPAQPAAVWPATPQLGAVSLTWRDAPAKLRDLATQALSEATWGELCRHGATGVLELHTCARSMWILSGEPATWLSPLLQARVAALAGTTPAVYLGADAAKFALSVAIGLDSSVEGESDVGRQFAAASLAARAAGRSDAALHGLDQGAARLLTEGHREGFVRANRGVAQLAVAALAGRVGTQEVVGIVGTGAMGERVATSLQKAGFPAPVRYNRTPSPGVLPLDSLGAHPALVVCTAGPTRWLSPPAGTGFVVDLGRPPQVAESDLCLDSLLAGPGARLPAPKRRAAEAAVERQVTALGERLSGLAMRRSMAKARELRDRFLADELPAVLGAALAGLGERERLQTLKAAEKAVLSYDKQLRDWLASAERP